MAEPLITEDQLAQLLANGARSAGGLDLTRIDALCERTNV